ncbi:MAG: hypothetical protein DWQ07_09635 [Chloroflexi bacterium]|nr:MAG: hypothetical protein DWQ07_09635 [Chloroflexota bacterium]MBL1193025.1 hypothetical protein [Chloroflexota bacterium]NOH10318.1 hypothetical protein [Chloroflexota bacterium]
MNLDKETFVGLPFYIFISLLVGALASTVINSLLASSTPQQAWLFGALIAVHLVLYWVNISLHQRSHWPLLYYPLQAILITTIGLIPFSENIIGTLAIAIIGEALGLWGNSRRALWVGLSFGGLFIFAIVLRLDPPQIAPVLTAIAVNGSFIIITLFLFNQQLAQRARAEALLEELEEANQQLEANAARIESLTLEAERERMARELHDTLAQGVAGLILQIEAIKANQQQGQDEKVGDLLDRALRRARNTLSESRAAIEDLRNQQSMDFSEIINTRLEQFKRSNKADLETNINLDEGNKVPAHIQHHAKRVLTEALSNIEKHAQALNVSVTVTQTSDKLRIEVSDDGKGFDTEAPLAQGHFGLLGLDERARLTQSEYKITSKSGEGTQLSFTFPLDKQDEHHD